MKNKMKITVQSPADKNESFQLPTAVAWAAARGIARDTHHAVILEGSKGKARFRSDGTGVVEWGESSDRREASTEFAANTIVSI